MNSIFKRLQQASKDNLSHAEFLIIQHESMKFRMWRSHTYANKSIRFLLNDKYELLSRVTKLQLLLFLLSISHIWRAQPAPMRTQASTAPKQADWLKTIHTIGLAPRVSFEHWTFTPSTSWETRDLLSL